MKAAARTYPVQNTLLYSAALFIVSVSLFVALAPRAQAAALTSSQAEQVQALLQSFGTDDTTLANVQLALSGASRADVLGAMAATASSSRPVKPSMALSKPPLCPALARTLKRGDTGEDVSKLQAFLAANGILMASSTGYFGPATEGALKEWQAEAGIVTEGSATTTGFGAAGPKTRQALMARCSEALPPIGSQASSTPICVLTASKSTINLGESVTLQWKSRNATYASTPGGDKGEPNGSVTLTPTETATYQKHVYGTTGEGTCTATVTVSSTTPATEIKVVSVPEMLGRALSLMGAGTASVFDAYLSLFGL